MNKNDEIKIEITGMTSEGNGVGRYNGMAVFTPLTALGDVALVKIVKKEKNFAYGKLLKLIKPSPDRCEDGCVCYSMCGGCSFRHINYEAECKIKSNMVRDALSRIGGIDVPLSPIMYGKSEKYRNKAQYPISPDGKTGFFAARSHRIIPCDGCALQPDEFSVVTKAVELFIKQYGVSVYNSQTGKGLLRHIYIRSSAAGDIMAVLVINGENLPHGDALCDILRSVLGERLKSFMININRERTNVILGNRCKTLYGDGYITDTLCGVRLRVSPLSFCQVNHDMAQRLYEKVAEYADVEGKTVIDLYCGTGAIGLTLAKKAKSVIGVEIVPQAVEDAKVNAAENGITNARFICADAAAAAEQLRREGVRADTVIVDPPRKGCDRELLETVANFFKPETLVYVSCNPATLARDCKILSKLGYSAVAVTPADLFPRTAHVETVCLLKRTV